MNFGNILSLINTCITAVFSWFNSVLTATGSYYYVLGGIITMLIFRFLIFPLVAGRPVTIDFKKDAQQSEEDMLWEWVNEPWRDK